MNSRAIIYMLLMQLMCTCSLRETEYIYPVPHPIPVSITNNGFAITWSGLPLIEHYSIEVSSKFNFTAEHLLDDFPQITEDTTFATNTLDAGRTYYFRLKAKIDDDEYTGYSPTLEIDLSPIASPEALAADSVGNDRFLARWNPAPEVEGYFLEVSDDIDFEQISQIHTIANAADSCLMVDGLQHHVNYFYRLRSFRQDLRSRYSNKIMVMTMPLEPPVVASISVSHSSASITLMRKQDADAYQLQVSENALFEKAGSLIHTIEQASPVFELDSLSPDVQYYFRARVYKDSVYSSFSPVEGFLTQPLPFPAQLQLGQLYPGGLTINWNPVSDADSYMVSIWKDDYLLKQESFNQATAQISGLKAGNTYFITVASSAFEGFSSPSPPIEVTLPVACPIKSLLIADGGYRHLYYNQAGQVYQITTEKNAAVTKRISLEYHDEVVVTARIDSLNGSGAMVEASVLSFAYDQSGNWVSLHKTSADGISQQYLEISYSSGLVERVLGYASADKLEQLSYERYIYSGDMIVASVDQAGNLLKEWKYAEGFNPVSQYPLPVQYILDQPTMIVGNKAKQAVSYYHDVAANQVKVFVYDQDANGVTTRLYGEDMQNTIEYIFEVCQP